MPPTDRRPPRWGVRTLAFLALALLCIGLSTLQGHYTLLTLAGLLIGWVGPCSAASVASPPCSSDPSFRPQVSTGRPSPGLPVGTADEGRPISSQVSLDLEADLDPVRVEAVRVERVRALATALTGPAGQRRLRLALAGVHRRTESRKSSMTTPAGNGRTSTNTRYWSGSNPLPSVI